MSQLKATPGPWKLTPCPCGNQHCQRQQLENVGVFYMGTGFEPADANLIAASPDLYQMTEWLERIFKYEIAKAERDNPEDDEGVRLRQLNLSLVQDALAKARGEAA